MQFQLATLSPSLSHHLKWGSFVVNTHGGLGRNIPCDLFNEHMNKLFREIINSMGANMTASAIDWLVLLPPYVTLETFDSKSNVPVPTTHSTKSGQDVDKVVWSICTSKE